MANAAGQSARTRRVQKSAAAFRTISEVSENLDVPQHVLRFWETKFAQVRPLKRGGGRRYYRPEDIDLLRRIKQLLYQEGYTIKGVQRLLREGGVRGLVQRVNAMGTTAGVSSERATAGGASSRASRDPVILDAAKRAELEQLLAELKELRKLLRNAPD